MFKADFKKLDLAGLRVYLYIQKRQVQYFTEIEPKETERQHAESEVQRATEAIELLTEGGGEAARNSRSPE